MKRVWAASLAAVVCLTAACASGSTHTSGAGKGDNAGVSATEIHIGTSNALTGPVASVCLPTSAGQTAWFDKVNDEGGVNGRKIVDTVMDDGYQAPRAIANVRTFTTDGVFALVGGCGTVTAAAIANAVRDKSMPYLFPYAAVPALVRPTRPNIYSLLPLYDDQSRALIPYALGRDGSGSVYAMTSEIPGYEDDVTGVKEGTAAAKARFIGSELLPATNAPAEQAAVKVGQAKPDYLMMTVLAPDAARILNSMASAGQLPQKAVLGVSVLASQAFAGSLSPAAAELLQTASPTVPISDERAQDCIDALKKYEPDTKPDAFALYGCAAAQVFVAALKQAGSDPTRTSLEAALDGLNAAAVSPLLPPVTFSNDNHLGLSSMFLLKLHGTTFVAAGTLPITAPAE